MDTLSACGVAGDTPPRWLGRDEFELVAESIPHIVWIKRPDGTTEYLNRHGVDFTGLAREETYDWAWLDLLHPDDVEVVQQAWARAIRTGTDYAADMRMRGGDGAYHWMASRGAPTRAPDGTVIRWIGTLTNIDGQKRLEDDLRRAQRETAESLTLLDTLQSTAPIGFGFVDLEFRFVRVNQTLADMNGRTVEEHLGRTVAEMLPALWPQIESCYRKVLESGTAVVDVELTGDTATKRATVPDWLSSFYPVRVDGSIIGIGVVILDITERKQAEAFRAAVMDNMVEGLYTLDGDGSLVYMNRAASRLLGWTLDELRGKSMHEAVHFQRSDGTPVPGSECPLLRVRSEGRSVRVTDETFTRKDGSTFPVAYSSAPVRIGSTLRGVVVVFRDITDEQEEKARANRELAALNWLGRIRDALDEHRFVLYSQPIIALDGGRDSEELLLRMVGPTGKVILPGSFLPVAEKYGLIGEIDRWVITQAIRRAATGRIVEVNVSAASIAATDLLGFIEHELEATGADPRHLVFEITETALMHDIEAGETFARSLADLGCRLALDDFGTGFGSFTYLKKLPVHCLKIDTEFVRELAGNPANQHVVNAIVSLARAFDLATIAEGVEDAETLALLQRAGVDYAQGLHLGPPLPIERY